MAVPKATVNKTKPWKTTSIPRRFHKASSNVIPDPTSDMSEIESKIEGNENRPPIKTIIKDLFNESLFCDFVLNISPDRNKIARVPTATANWNIAT